MLAASAVFCVAGCSPTGTTELPPPVSPTNHKWFPLGAGTTHEYGKVVPVDGDLKCESCHPATAASLGLPPRRRPPSHSPPVTKGRRLLHLVRRAGSNRG